MFDHYLFGQNETESANAMQLIAQPPPARVRPPIVTRYGVDFCSVCSLMVEYCRCGLAAPDDPSKDARAESDLNRRIREAKGR